MKDALACGDRTVMMHQGEIVLDVVGEQRANLQVTDLLDMFSHVKGGAVG